MWKDSLSSSEHSSVFSQSSVMETKKCFVQKSLRQFVTYHSKFRSSEKITTTPKSSKIRKCGRKALADITNVSSGTTFNQNDSVNERIRKRGSESVFEVNTPMEVDSSVIVLNDECESSHKRRRGDMFVFEEESEKSSFIFSASSSSSMTLAKTFNDSTSSDDFSHCYSLPVVLRPQIENRAFASISGETLVRHLKSLTSEDFNCQFMLVDCRYPYEYNGGHIKNAVNIYDPAKIKELFFSKDSVQFQSISSKIPIFYCEFSQKRSVSMAMELRRQDRQKNVYPNLDFKEVYILDYGYRKFFLEDNHASLCCPSGYIPMIDENYAHELKRYCHHKRKATKQTSCIELRTMERRREEELVNVSSSSSSTLTAASSMKSLTTLLDQSEESFYCDSSVEWSGKRSSGQKSQTSIVSQLEGCLSRVNLDMSLA